MRLKKSLITFYRRVNNPVLFSIFFFLFLALFFITKITFSVSVIEISGSKELKGLKTLQGQFIFFIFSKKFEKQLYDLNPQIKSVQLVKIYPNKIHIDVKKYNTLAIFEVEAGYFFLSEDGRILEKRKEQKENLPIIHYYQKFYFNEYNSGDKLEYKDILYCLFFVNKLHYLGVKIDSIDINGLDMLIFNSGDKKYIFTTSKEKQLQYGEFKTIIERFKIERTEYASIDLRFEKPIIKFR